MREGFELCTRKEWVNISLAQGARLIGGRSCAGGIASDRLVVESFAHFAVCCPLGVVRDSVLRGLCTQTHKFK